jgi:hypothetical protein
MKFGHAHGNSDLHIFLTGIARCKNETVESIILFSSVSN